MRFHKIKVFQLPNKKARIYILGMIVSPNTSLFKILNVYSSCLYQSAISYIKTAQPSFQTSRSNNNLEYFIHLSLIERLLSNETPSGSVKKRMNQLACPCYDPRL